MKKPIPKSKFSRSSRILGLGARLLSSELSKKIRTTALGQTDLDISTKTAQALALVETLGSMKGAAMKAGQLLALEVSDWLPEEVTAILRQLHDNATTMPIEEVEAILAHELSPERYASLTQLSSEPIGSASIGQVHTAVIDGKKVAIKVQIPGIVASIDSDLALLKKLISTVFSLKGVKIPLDGLFAELADSLHQETNYELEARHIQTYKEFFKDNPAYRIPDTLDAYSTKRVLTLSYETGEKLSTWIAKSPEKEAVHQFTDRVLSLVVQEFFHFGVVQTDPNYGNFLYRPQESVLVLLDFGATHFYEPNLRKDVKTLLKMCLEADDDDLLQQCYRMDLLDARETEATKDLFLEFLDLVAYLFRPQNQPIDFADTTYLASIRATSLRLSQQIKYSHAEAPLLFLNRKLGGMFHLLKDAGATVDLTRYLNMALYS